MNRGVYGKDEAEDGQSSKHGDFGVKSKLHGGSDRGGDDDEGDAPDKRSASSCFHNAMGSLFNHGGSGRLDDTVADYP